MTAARLPIMLRLTRRGNTITPSYSLDEGQTFLAVGGPLTFAQPLAPTLHVGLAISSNDRDRHSEAAFSDFQIATP